MTRYVVFRDMRKPIGTVQAASWVDAFFAAKAMYGGDVFTFEPDEVSTVMRWMAALRDRQAGREAASMHLTRKG